MPMSWNQFVESEFPLDDYDKEIPVGDYEVVLDEVCVSRKTSSRGSGIHLFAPLSETGMKHWFFVFYGFRGDPSYGTARTAKSGDRLRLVIEMGRRGTPMGKGCPSGGWNDREAADSFRPEPGRRHGRGRDEWAASARSVGKGARAGGHGLDGRAEDSSSPPIQAVAMSRRKRCGSPHPSYDKSRWFSGRAAGWKEAAERSGRFLPAGGQRVRREKGARICRCRQRLRQVGAIWARVRKWPALVDHSRIPGLRDLEIGFVCLVPWFHSKRVETPSPSGSRWAKPSIRVSTPCSRAEVSGIPSGDVWDC